MNLVRLVQISPSARVLDFSKVLTFRWSHHLTTAARLLFIEPTCGLRTYTGIGPALQGPATAQLIRVAQVEQNMEGTIERSEASKLLHKMNESMEQSLGTKSPD
jgi:hypothetical protein